MWDYLGKHFLTIDELKRLQNLPLLPLDISQLSVTLARLTQPSKMVVRNLHGDHLDDNVTEVLKVLGVTVMQEYPDFLRLHPALANAFVHPPSVKGVLRTMAASLPEMVTGMHKVTDHGKRSLRKFISKASSLEPEEKQVLHSLPLFETLFKTFVSKENGLRAAPEESFPVAPRRDLIDIKEDASKRLVVLMDIRILTAHEFFIEEVFPGVEEGYYSAEKIDRLMVFVLEHYQVYSGADWRFKEKLKSLPFVSTKSRRVKPMEIFDPRKDLLRRIFAEEDVFPTGELYNDPAALVILETLGMKGEGNITGQELYQSAKSVSNISSLQTAERKSEAIMQYITRNPSKLQETTCRSSLGVLLQDISWVSRVREKPNDYPQRLPFWGETCSESHFHKPSEVKSDQLANLIGSLKPVVKTESSSQVATFFSWNMKPTVFEVAQHLKNVISSYNTDEKPRYIMIIKEIYQCLSQADRADVKVALCGLESLAWVWNGDGFFPPNLMLSKKPPIDLSPYVRSLPSEVEHFSAFFASFGLQEQCDDAFLLQVLHLIKQKYDNGTQFSTSEVKKDLQLSVDILNEVKPNVGDQLSPTLQEKVLIPTHVEGDTYLKLAPVEDCMYCEHEWLERSNHDESMDYMYVHPNIPNSTAELLLVPTLMNRMLEPDELEIGEEFGQEEKLTRRLSRLLEDYTDGFAVPKELVQNADDAGATEIRFLYDERTNEDAMTCLIDEGMRHCQGPALWVYNDAEFRDEDFKNISKLNGATKECDIEKIGKFGLGFNAVYNLTDVPMFVSRNYFVIFDPNTFYLGKAIRNKNKPGMKIDINKNTRRLKYLSNQFKPFNGIFDCDLRLEKEDNSFHGTLFRFPLRTKEQAVKSEIKQLHYDNTQVEELLRLFTHGAKSLLLFTQNVRRIQVFHLPRETASASPEQPTLLFEVSKALHQDGILRELSVPVTLSPAVRSLSNEEQNFLKQCNFLRASSEVAKQAGDSISSNTDLLSSALMVTIKSTVTDSGKLFLENNGHLQDESEVWLVASSMGKGNAMQFAKGDKSLLPSAGVAARIIPGDYRKLLPVPVVEHVPTKEPHYKGKLFCFLPLPICSGFPVHVNGAFAVAASRRSLKEKTADDKSCPGVEWNNLLMQDSICAAYLDLLEDLKKTATDEYEFHSLWPKSCQVEPNCQPLARSFYQMLASGSCSLFSDGNRWVDITQVVFLEPNFRQDPQVGDMSFEVFHLLKKGKEAIVDLPADVYKSFLECDLATVIQDKSYDKGRFFRELFFPNIKLVPSHQRDKLVLYVLDLCAQHDKNDDFDYLIKSHECIPASPDGQTLKCPGKLINPYKTAASLFGPEDKRFPFGTEATFLNSLRLAKLEQLGMLTDDLPWPEVVERAHSISILNESSGEAALKRVKALMNHLEWKLCGEEESSFLDDVRNKILEAKFLPLLQKPYKFPLRWKGDEIQTGNKIVLLSPKESFLQREKYLVCCSEPIVDQHMPTVVQKFLYLDKKKAAFDHVESQLDVASSINANSLDIPASQQLNKVCLAAYKHLQTALESGEVEAEQLRERFREKQFILCGDKFVFAKQVAFRLDVDCSPYLYQLPHDLAKSFDDVMRTAGVKETFQEEDFISCLNVIKQTFGDAKLDEKSLQVAVNVAVQLGNCMTDSKDDENETHENRDSFCLPDSKGMMRSVENLCMRDCPWMPDKIGVRFVSDMIPPETNKRLGVKTRREEALRHFSRGIPFGQKEKLTNRLKRILTSYPCEKEILKELLQNADDAQATEICFIKDPRQHQDEKVFGDSWKPLQGPALCVYNNKPFTEADIVGIQNLGEGSKGDDPNKTGQYGVGFNAVYHLTDVPSFVSSGEEIGDVLCVLDPHYKYMPGATASEPGMMFRETSELKLMFPDVFSCYIEDSKEFAMQNSTMFRFPLRTQDMADKSKISNSPVTLPALGDMMEALKGELFEVLLFVNNVRKITLCDIDEGSGKVVNSYSVEAEMSEADATKRQQFVSFIKQVAKTGDKIDQFSPTDIDVKRCSYVLTLRDSCGNEEKWLIVRQIGFDNEVPTSIIEAYKKGDLGMLPRGGVACLLEKNSKQGREGTTKKKAYCFLPLPLETDLPVHVNGHFALDHEDRRDLWKALRSDYRSDWNNTLLRDVIASCYLTLLDDVRNYLHLPITHSAEEVTLYCSKVALVKKINEYEILFPLMVSGNPYWETLVRSVYQGMDNKRLRFLPVVRGKASEATTSTVSLTWLPPTGEGKDEAFFNNLENSDCFAPRPRRFPPQRDFKINEKQRVELKTCFEETTPSVHLTWPPSTGEAKDVSNIEEGDADVAQSRCFPPQNDPDKDEKRRLELKTSFEDILLETAFNLVQFSPSVYSAFQESGVSSCCVSPSSVMEFYKTFKTEDPLCRIGSINVDIGETPFKIIEVVKLVLKYCKDDEHFSAKLPGLPLLVTQDNRLQEFSTSDPKFLSRHYGILPSCGEMFVHDRLRTRIFGEALFLKSPVFRQFGVQDFASNLHRTLPSQYYSADGYVKWSPEQDSLPNQNWVNKVWTFLNEGTSNTLKEIALKKQEQRSISEIREQEIRSIREVLQPLSNWSILPCTEKIEIPPPCGRSTSRQAPEHFLVPLKLAESVLDFVDADANESLVNALRKLRLAELNYAVLPSDARHLARKLVASLRKPESILTSLEQKMSTDPQSIRGKLNTWECGTILRYFSDNVACLREHDKSILRRLPFYHATHGGLISVDSARVCVLPFGIPREEMEQLGFRQHVVFLEGQLSLSPLFKSLGFQCVSAVDVYCNFILKYFDTFSSEGRVTHLRYIRDDILVRTTTSESDKEKLLTCLKNTAIVTSKDGNLKKASSFYDPHNDVFKVVVSKDMFPPEPFIEDEWLSFMKKIGLICEVSQDLFKTFATEVAREGAMQRTEVTDEKSKVLVKHLFLRDNVVAEGLLQDVSDIPFVATNFVREELRALHSQFGEESNGNIRYTAFSGSVIAEHTKIVWSTAALLPDWADPENYQYSMNVPVSLSKRSYCNGIIAQLHILRTPTVELVASHCQNLSWSLEKENDSVLTSFQKDTRKTVMRNIYRFLQAKAMPGAIAKGLLAHTPCVLVEQGGRLVYAKQVVIELYSDLEIKPFLYRVPSELSEFTQLFKYLGCCHSVTPSHYAMVLNMLHGRCKGKQLDPNEVSSALKAVKGLLETMQVNPKAEQDISTLYLPAVYPFSGDFALNVTVLPVVLMKASELIFDDAPHYLDRIHNFSLPFLVDLKMADVGCKSNVNYKDLVMLLPTVVQPQMMSCVIEEKFVQSQDDSERFDFGAASSLRKQLHSEQFFRGIIRLIRHANQDGGLDESVVATVRCSLQSIEFLGMSKIVTHLVHCGEVIQGSEREVSYFVEKGSDSGQNIWKVYVNAVQDAEETISTIALTLSQLIAGACRGLLRDMILLIPEMLRIDTGKIFSLLDKMRIRRDDSYDADKRDVFPPPGSFIPIAMHNLLNPGFEAFNPGEYVGYELHDPSLELQEGDATYIYAVIIEEVPADDVSQFTKPYKINIGEDKEPQIVEATKLYKFHRVQEVTSSEVALCNQQDSSYSASERQKIFDEISRALEEAWRLSEERRKQIVKRLFLQWHPDKNPGNEVFCTEVFQHIKSEIERLERGESRRGESYSAFYGFWGRRANQYSSQRQQYRDNFFRHCGSSGYRGGSWNVPPSFCTTNPQPREARRWFRQAEADLEAADNDIATEKPSYEWACFKCHQVRTGKGR